MQSNQGKTRVQDLLIREDVAVELKRKLDIGAWVFVCANEAAAKGCKAAFELLLRDRDVEGGFWSERYVEEVY